MPERLKVNQKLSYGESNVCLVLFRKYVESQNRP